MRQQAAEGGRQLDDAQMVDCSLWVRRGLEAGASSILHRAVRDTCTDVYSVYSRPTRT